MNNEQIYRANYLSPIGKLCVKTTNEAVTGISFHETNIPKDHSDHPLIQKTFDQLQQYFSGNSISFDLPLLPAGTQFQKEVWKQLEQVPYGQTNSYGQIAKGLGDPKKVRAVGRANGHNPISIIIPCHRIIGSNGNLTGYAGGVERKRWLLQHEGALLL